MCISIQTRSSHVAFKRIRAGYLTHHVALHFPHICVPPAAEVLGSSLQGVGVLFQAVLLPPGGFEGLQSCRGPVSGVMQGGFLFG